MCTFKGYFFKTIIKYGLFKFLYRSVGIRELQIKHRVTQIESV